MKRILIVEDQPATAKITRILLESWGYRVLEAHGAPEAVELFEHHAGEVRLLLTDIVMPGMRGTEAAQKLVSMAPNLKVLYMSGYTDNAMFHQKLLDTGTLFIQKPFTLDILEDKVAKALKVKSKAATGNRG